MNSGMCHAPTAIIGGGGVGDAGEDIDVAAEMGGGAGYSDVLTSVPLSRPVIAPGIHAQVEDGHNHSGFSEPDRRNVRINDLVHVVQQKAALVGIHSVLDSAPTRISFTSIPDVDDF
jgi:hypothetical protein